jgi:peptidyl-tRNA hydrolase, PTH1 family
MEGFYLMVGLGNPGGDYARTRHNAGFMVVERLAARWRAEWKQESRFNARVARANYSNHKVLLCQPQTYMNQSGQAVGALTTYYQVPQDRLLIIVDDADLPLGTLRLKPLGSPGGHHGLESIERHLGGQNYARLRFGIGRDARAGRQITAYVLGRFQASEMGLLEKVLERAADQAECWLKAGSQQAMNAFNGTIEPPGTKES